MLKIQVPGVGIIEVPEEEKDNLAKIVAAFSPEKQAKEDRTEFFNNLSTLFQTQSKETIDLFTKLLEAVSSIKVDAPKVEVTVPDLTEGLKEALAELKIEPRVDVAPQEVTFPEVQIPAQQKAKKIKVDVKRKFGKPGEVEGTVEVLEWV